MKVTELKKIIKEAVREVLNEELGSMKGSPVTESQQQVTTTPQPPAKTPEGQSAAIQNILKETAKSGEWRTALNMNSSHAQPPLQMGGNVDLANGSLPQGEVSMDAIKNLMGGRK